MPIRKIESYEIRGFQRENRPPFGEFGKKPAGFDGERTVISENLRSRDKKFEKFTDIRQKSGGAFYGIIKIYGVTERIEGPGPAKGAGGEPFRQVGPKGPEGCGTGGVLEKVFGNFCSAPVSFGRIVLS